MSVTAQLQDVRQGATEPAKAHPALQTMLGLLDHIELWFDLVSP